MEATENVQAAENAETSEEVKVQKRDERRIRRSFSGRRCLSQSVRGRQGQNGY